ncbi:MAG: shikimate kinase [Taibaiella sp.]|nr:shikimate kinase [Taibaiella sp.]
MSMVFLIGMPGVGKTYWARQIADAFGINCIDLDNYIMQKEGVSIQALFDTKGEEYFRDAELKALQQIINISEKEPAIIVATGGGTPCYFDNINLLKKAGKVLWLTGTNDTLINHLKKEQNRPLLLPQNDLQQYLSDILAERQPYYQQAHHILQVENISILTFDQILKDV